MTEDSATIRDVRVTRRTLEQKEVTITATDGKWGKNEIVLHWTGLKPDFDINQAVWEVENAMQALQKVNPGHLELTNKGTKKLPQKR
jgi:hypothetical protein